MSAQEKEDDGDGEEEFFGWGILITVVDLLPHVQIIVGAGVELERYPSHPVEHEI